MFSRVFIYSMKYSYYFEHAFDIHIGRWIDIERPNYFINLPINL